MIFDGVCNLCDGAVQFVLKHDAQGRIHFGSIQSETGSQFYRQHGLDPEKPHTMLFISPQGVFHQSDAALEIASAAGLDLVEVAPDERPPVCRILDYGKFKYEQKRKQAKSQKTHQVQVKEIRLRPKTGDHDIEVKLKQARQFLSEKDKVKVNIEFKGREMAHIDLGRAILLDVITKLEDVAKVERTPIMEGKKKMSAILAPK